jgi:hypothetical protein
LCVKEKNALIPKIMTLNRWIVVGVTLAWSGCGPNGDSLGQPGGVEDAGGIGSMDGGPTRPDAPPVESTPDAASCGTQDFELTRGPLPNLLLVLDRSSSMDDDAPSGSGSKWTQVRTALLQMMPTSQSQIQWGLEIFPSDGDCGVSSTVDVPTAANNAAAIAAKLTAMSPDGSTPTKDAIRHGASYLQGLTDGGARYLLLATDGEPNCEGLFDDATDLAKQAVADAKAAGIPTFVLGIAADSSANDALNQLARASGEARPSGPPYYYPVGSGADLSAVLETIAAQVISCTFPLGTPPPDPSRVQLSAGSTEIPRDPTHADGWDLDDSGSSVELYGSWCRGAQNGTVSALHATYGCPPIGIHRDPGAETYSPSRSRR